MSHGWRRRWRLSGPQRPGDRAARVCELGRRRHRRHRAARRNRRRKPKGPRASHARVRPRALGGGETAAVAGRPETAGIGWSRKGTGMPRETAGVARETARIGNGRDVRGSGKSSGAASVPPGAGLIELVARDFAGSRLKFLILPRDPGRGPPARHPGPLRVPFPAIAVPSRAIHDCCLPMHSLGAGPGQAARSTELSDSPDGTGIGCYGTGKPTDGQETLKNDDNHAAKVDNARVAVTVRQRRLTLRVP